MKEKFVIIQSNETIRVTPGLQNLDVTNPDAHVPDRLKVSPLWPNAMVLISKGQFKYPAEIAEWPTVKALAKDKVLTIGAYTNEADETEKQVAEDLKLGLDTIAAQTETKENAGKEQKSLADMAGDEE